MENTNPRLLRSQRVPTYPNFDSDSTRCVGPLFHLTIIQGGNATAQKKKVQANGTFVLARKSRRKRIPTRTAPNQLNIYRREEVKGLTGDAIFMTRYQLIKQTFRNRVVD